MGIPTTIRLNASFPSIRVNAPVPFPAKVAGAGVVEIAKANGIWTISLDFSKVADINPLPADYPSLWFVVEDFVNGVFGRVSLQEMLSPPSPTYINHAASPYAATSADTSIYVDTTAGAVTILLQPTAIRGNLPLIVKDYTGHANANNITLTPNGAEKIDGLASYVLIGDFVGANLGPTTAGYAVLP